MGKSLRRRLFSTWKRGYSLRADANAPHPRSFDETSAMNGEGGDIVTFDNVGLRYGADKEVLSDI